MKKNKKEITEGKFVKGGINKNPPISPRPEPPIGQGGKNIIPIKKVKQIKIDISEKVVAALKSQPKIVPEKIKPKMICPKCGHTFFNILGSKYECMMCAFIGPLAEFYKGFKKS